MLAKHFLFLKLILNYFGDRSSQNCSGWLPHSQQSSCLHLSAGTCGCVLPLLTACLPSLNVDFHTPKGLTQCFQIQSTPSTRNPRHVLSMTFKQSTWGKHTLLTVEPQMPVLSSCAEVRGTSLLPEAWAFAVGYIRVIVTASEEPSGSWNTLYYVGLRIQKVPH